MKLTGRSIFWLTPPLLVALFLVLGVVADAWLETAGGRQLLQDTLGQHLGRSVRLGGDYHFRWFPRPGIAGTGFSVPAASGEALLAYSKYYSAAIELLPFIQGQLRIASIELSDGFFDLNLNREAPAGGASPQPAKLEALPQVEFLGIRDFYIRFGAEGTGILLEHLQITGFQSNRTTPVTLTAVLMEGGVKGAETALEGELTATVAPMSASLHIQKMAVNWSGILLEGLTGQWEWNEARGQLTGDMAWCHGVHTVGTSLMLTVGEPVSGRLAGRYGRTGFSAPLEVVAGFLFSGEQIKLLDVSLEQSGQSINGSGCVLLTEPASVQLTLASAELDLDALQETLPAGSGGDATGLVDLAVVLRVKKARFGGAMASDVVVEIGAVPDCRESISLSP